MTVLQSKPVAQSWTIWFNVLTVLSAVLVFLSSHELVVEYPNVVAALGAAAGVINIILRFKTTQPLKPIQRPEPR